MDVRRRLRQSGGAGQRHPAHDQALQAGIAGTVVGEIGVIVLLVPMSGVDRGIAVRREAQIEPGKIERWRGGQQQDQAKAKPLPQRARPMLPNTVHAGSLGKVAGFRHP